jgi:hypothetical protein
MADGMAMDYRAWADEHCRGAERSVVYGPLLEAAYAAGRRAGLDAADDAIVDAIQGDLENGVRVLNEIAAEDFARKYPELNAALSRALARIRALQEG